MKTCRKCGVVKPYDDFRNHRTNKDGRTGKCKPCLAIERKEKHDPDKVRAAWLRDKYGLTVDEYDAIYKAQQGSCAICGVHESKAPGRFNRLHVDHCHTTGEVRGLLCYTCNSVLGYARDSEDILLNAIQYLRR